MVWTKPKWSRRLDVYLLFTISSCFFLALKINQHISFRTTFEPADYELILWNTLHGRFLQMVCSPLTFFSEHFSPILLLILPIYAIIQSPITLLVIHAIAISAAVIPLYFLAAQYTTLRWPPLALGIAYVLSRTVNYGLMYDVHPEVFYPVLFFSLFLAYKKSKWSLYYLILFICFMVKEDVFIASFGLGMYLLFSKERKHGFITAGLSLIGLFSIVILVIPFFLGQSSGSDYRFVMYWSGYGSSQKEILLNFLNPLKHFEVIFTVGKLKQMFNLFSVFIFLPFFSWRALIFLVLPNWFILYSSNNGLMNGPIVYYGMLITPFLFFASILGITSSQIIWPTRKDKLILIFSTLIFVVQLGNSRIFKQVFYDPWSIPERYSVTANEIIKLIPPHAAVSAQVNLVPHVPLHPCRSCFPLHLDKADYIFLDYQNNFWPLSELTYLHLVDSLKRSPEWKTISEKDNFCLLKKSK
jgi:uncharacterized membrane protein